MDLVLDELKVFSGTSHPELTKAVCDYLQIPVGQSEAFKFANDNTFVRILENIRQRDVFIIQPTCAPTNDNLMELLIMIDACKRASAGRITAVVPYYGYGRTDKKDQPRVPITGRLVADLLTAAGADRMLTVDLHAGQIQGFFNIPVDELTAMPILADYFRAKEISDLVVVAVDVGISKRARDVAERLNAPLAIIEKRRLGNNDRAETLNVIGEVEGKTALTFDDEILTGGSVVNAAQALVDAGVEEVYGCELARAMNAPELLEDPRFGTYVSRTVNVEAARQVIQELIGPLSLKETLECLEAHDVPCAPVRTAEQVLGDPHFWDRGSLTAMRHAGMTEPVKGVASGYPVRFSGGELPESPGAPTLGMHNQEIFAKLLGLNESDLQDLAEQKII